MDVTNVAEGEVIQNLNIIHDNQSIHSLSLFTLEEGLLRLNLCCAYSGELFGHNYNTVERISALYRGPLFLTHVKEQQIYAVEIGEKSVLANYSFFTLRHL